MAKIKLGAKPEAFKPFPVTFTLPDGSQSSITATFRYRTRREFGQLMNEMFGGSDKDKTADAKVDFVKVFSDVGAKNAGHLQAALVAWDLDEELTLENLQALADELPAAAAALMQAYSVAVNEGRLGN